MRPISIFPLLALAASACSNPVCADDVRKRLLDDCKVVVGWTQAGQCNVLDGAPGGQAAFDAAFERHSKDLCEVADPDDLDADCLKTATCDEIARNACSDSSAMASSARQSCLDTCRQEVMVCQQACGMRANFESCLACDLDCSGVHEDCIDACPN